MRGAGTPPEAPLPAPYESPWLALSRSFQAVGADLRLRLRLLWRLRPWLVIGLALALVVLLGLAGFGLRQLLSQPSAAPVPEPVPARARPDAPVVELPRQADPAPMPTPAAPQPVMPEPLMQLPAMPESAAPERTESEPAEPEPDPLLDAFAAADPGWIAAASPSPERDLLTLTLAAAPPSSSDSGLQRRLERWQALAHDLGYGNLAVCTAEGRLLARSALVGSGMILLDSAFLS